jgi:tetratricopeptide (TPR) repeat protein
LGHHFWGAGDHDQAVASIEQALDLLTPLQDFDLQLLGNSYSAQAYHGRGDYQRAIEFTTRNVATLEGDPLHRPVTGRALPSVFSRCWLVWSLAEVGNFKEGATRADEGIKIAEAADHLFSLFHACWGAGVLFLRQGDLQRAILALERSRWVCQITTLVFMYNFTIPHLGFAYVLDGRGKEGLLLIEEAVQQTEVLGMLFCHTISLTLLGETYLLAGRIDEANQAAQRALKLCREYKSRGYEAWTLRLLGGISSHESAFDPEKSEKYYREAIALANELGMRPLIAHCHDGLGKLFAKVKRTQEGREHVATAITMYREMEMYFWLEKAEADMKFLSGGG